MWILANHKKYLTKGSSKCKKNADMNWSDSIWGQNLAFKTCDESCIAACLVFKLMF